MKRGNDDKIETMRGIPFLQDVHRSTLVRLATVVDVVSVPAGAELTREGTAGKEAFVVIEGEVDVVVDGELVATLGKGEFVGETALLDRGPRTATVVTRTPARLLALDRRQFHAFIEDPAVGPVLSRALAQRIRAADQQLATSRA